MSTMTRPRFDRARRRPPRRVASLIAGGALAAACLLSVATSAAAAGRRTAARACSAAQTRVWLGDGPGGGTAGTVFYPLEFSNVGHVRCTLYGYPGVSAYGSAGRRIGRPAIRSSSAHRTVTLAPGATAHALLGIRDWGAICTRRVSVRGLRVYAPGSRPATPIAFPFGACARTSVLVVAPVRPGVGIPGETSS